MPFAIAAIGGALVGGIAANQAANTQAGAASDATKAQLAMFGQTQANLSPYMQAGQGALSQINAGLQPGGMFEHQFNLQDFQASPAYQFNLQQGQMAIDKAANARGGLYAPQTLQDLSKFSQGLASNEFQNAFSNYNTGINNIYNRLSGMAGAGQNAAVNLGAFSGQVGGQIGSNIIGAGNAQAAGQVGVANALQGGMSNLTNTALIQQMLQQQQGGNSNVYYTQQGDQ